MGKWQPATTRGVPIVIATAVLLAAVGGAAVMAPSAEAQADLTLDTLSVSGANQTVGGNVTDVMLSTTLDYQHDVPDATRRIVKLKAGPSADDLTLLDYQQVRDPAGTASGSVTLSGSVLDHSAWTADTFAPGIANTTSQEVVVQAVVEVHRETGDVVRHSVTDTATVTLTDDTELTVSVGGTGNVTVRTA